MKSANGMSLTKKLCNYALSLHVRMRHKSWWRVEVLLIAGALLFGLVSAVLSHVNQEQVLNTMRQQWATVKIAAAKHDLPVGHVLTREDLVLRPYLENGLSGNFVKADTVELLIGRSLEIELKKYDPILLSGLDGNDSLAGIAAKIPPGMRLFTLAITDNAAANGFIKPNDHVDIIAHLQLPKRGLTAFTLLQDVTLISVGKSTVQKEFDSQAATNVSFLIEAKDAEMLAFAQSRGTFSLSLRNPADTSVQTKRAGVDMNGFLDDESIEPASGGGTLKISRKGVLLDELQ